MPVEAQLVGLLLAPGDALRRVVVRCPVMVWRLGLGPVFGGRLVLVTLADDQGGLRRTVRDYARHNAHKYVIEPDESELQAGDYVTVQTDLGAERMQVARVVDGDELRHVYAAFMRTNPPLIGAHLTARGVEASPGDVADHADRLNILRFDPTPQLTPPPLEADLSWVWPVGMGILIMQWLWRQVVCRVRSRA